MEMINPFLEQGEMVLQIETHEIFDDPETNKKLANPNNGMFFGVALNDYVAVVYRNISSGVYERAILSKMSSLPVYKTQDAVDFAQFITWMKAVGYEQLTKESSIKTYQQILEENEFTREDKSSDTGSNGKTGQASSGDRT